MTQRREQFQRRWARWRDDARCRRLIRQQLWHQRRARVRWEVRRSQIARHNQWHQRSALLTRRSSHLRRRWSEVTATLLSRGSEVTATLLSRGSEVTATLLSRGWEAASSSVRGHTSVVTGRLAPGSVRASSRRWRSGLSDRLRLTGAGLSRRLSGMSSQVRGWHPSRTVVVTTAMLLLGGVAGYAVIRAVGDLGSPRPSAEGTAQPAANHPISGARGPGLTRPGIFVSVGVNKVGGLDVSEEARTGQPVSELSIAPPPALDGAKRLPRLEDVRVYADGAHVETPTIVEVTTVVELDRPAKVIELRYRLVGASARSKPATAGRATLSLRPALATTYGQSRAVIEVHDARVHALVCVELPPERQLCGVARDGGWRTQRLDTTSSAVVARVDLPDRAA